MKQKESERILLREFVSLYPDFPPGSIEDSEEPDFLISTPTSIVGVELTRYVRGQKLGKGSGGSQLRREDNLREQFTRLARLEFERKYGWPLYVTFLWTGHKYLRVHDLKPLAIATVDLVSKSLPTHVNKLTQLRSEQLENPVLVSFFESISIMRLESSAIGGWSSIETGFIQAERDELEALVSSKEKKIQSYLQKCDSVWLLIVADGLHVASTAHVPERANQHSFKSRFSKLIFYDRADRQVVVLENAEHW